MPRLDLIVPDEAMFCIDEHRGRMRTSQRAEVIRHALSVYDYLVKAAQGGKQIVIRSPDGSEKTVKLPDIST